jgi:CubicO group peptidase (beta-lactamase class C family)
MTGKRHLGRLTSVAAVLLAATALAAQAKGASDTSGWQKVSPASVGLDAAKLNQIAQEAKKGKSNCLVVVRDGKLAGEWYFNGTGPNTTQDVYSVTKSFTSTLVGIAQDDGKLHVGDKASTWIPSWSGTSSDPVTVQDLLSMDSGRQWSFESDYVQLLGAADRTAYATGLGQSEPPETQWTYNNAAVQTLEQVLQSATGEDVATYARDRIFAPLGMTHTAMGRDKAGNPQMFEGLHSTCRDLARFGELMLDRGKWGSKQIVSSSWVKQATGASSTKLNAAYGYLWWLNRSGTIVGPFAASSVDGAENQASKQGQMVKGAPAGMYWAIGLGNQLIQIDPATKTVVVRLGKPEPNPKPPTFGVADAAKVVTQAITKPKKK